MENRICIRLCYPHCLYAAVTGFILFFLPGTRLCAQQQDPVLAGLSQQWKADTAGRYGFRQNQVMRDSIQGTVLVMGIKLEGWSRKKVLDLLGEPDKDIEYLNCIEYDIHHCEIMHAAETKDEYPEDVSDTVTVWFRKNNKAEAVSADYDCSENKK